MRGGWRWWLVALLAPALSASAQAPSAPRAAPPHIDAAQQRVVASAREALDGSDDGYSLRRRRARARAEQRACGAIHAFVDGSLARSAVSPLELSELHAAVEAHCARVATRPTIDGGAVVEVAVPLEVLRGVASPAGAPW